LLIDSHAHLDTERFHADREDVLRRAHAAGVETILSIGTGDGPGTMDCAIRVAREFNGKPETPQIWASIGVHPHDAEKVKESDYKELEALAREPEVIGWGEIGLDYFYDHSPRDVQKEVFRRQMELAQQARLPIIIHCRPSQDSNNAWDDCLQMIADHWKPSGLGGVLHCFTGTMDHVTTALDLGFMISFSGNITFPKAGNIREAAAAVPFDRMFIETDSPFLAPVPYRGKRNEPAFVSGVAAKVAEVRGITPDEVGRQTAANFRKFFNKTQTPKL
jgi:TatD DNase family protein